jgi:hypothetical protein
MMMDPNTIDALTKEWWEIRRAEILESLFKKKKDVGTKEG